MPRSLVRVAGLVAAALLSMVAALVTIGVPAQSTPGFSFTRLAGLDRYDTSTRVAQSAFPSGASVVLVANGTLAHFPDALAASYLAGYLKAPVVLTDGGSLATTATQLLQSLHPKAIGVIGGTAAVADSVLSQLGALGFPAYRIGGATRYDTAAAVAAVPPKSYVGTSGLPGGTVGVPTAVVASGANFPDALVSGPMAYASAFPVEITDPAGLSSQTQQSLQALGIRRVLIAGGTAAVSAAVESELTGLGIVPQRFAGADRTDTAAQIATYELQSLGYTNTGVGLARGDDPADSLSGGPLGGVFKTPILLTANPTVLGTYSAAWLAAHSSTLANGVIFGGLAAVSQQVQDQATAAARGSAGTVSVTANPQTLPTTAGSTSALTVTVVHADGTPQANDPVTISTSGSPTAACGVVVPVAGVTNSSGQVTATYAGSTTAGTCAITATEQSGGASGSVTITEGASPGGYAIGLASSPASPATLTVAPSANSTATLTATVTNGTAPAVGDLVTFNPTGTCGTLVPSTATPTGPTGTVTAVYTASTTAGTCTITAAEATGSRTSSAVTINQTTSGGGGGSGYAIALASNPPSPATLTVLSPTATLTATVTDNGAPVVGDLVTFNPSGTCGTLVPASTPTGPSGTATAVYTRSVTTGTCTITATEATGQKTSGAVTINQT